MSGLLQHWITQWAEKCPERVAVVLGAERMTYGQLEALSNQLARILKVSGAKRGDRVGLLLPKSPMAVVAMLGALKADCMYVPLDPNSPSPRLAKIVESCESRWILAAGSVVRLLDELLRLDQFRSIRVGWLERGEPRGENFQTVFSQSDLYGYAPSPPDCANTATDPAYILYTSGSTGIPKGVVVTHSNVRHFIEWATGYFAMNPTDRNSGHSPLHFDLSMFDIFGTIAAGAELHLVPWEMNLQPLKLADFMRNAELTQWFSAPSILNLMAQFDAVDFDAFPSLKRLMWCGEVFPTPALIYWMKRLPHVSFTNLYGPTETTIASSYYTVPECPMDERARIPIGTACPGEELLVLDEELRPVSRAQVGDLCIRGVGLAQGYWRDLEKTKAAFRRNPRNPSARIYKTGDLAMVGEDGLIYFIGRADTQIKSRGYRIELGEIEAALNALGLLQECAVVAVPTDGFEGNRICCAYAPLSGHHVSPLSLRMALSKLLPNYMLPSDWMALEKLPENANGKIDRNRLKKDFQKGPHDRSLTHTA